jgi:hypothetical protein
VSNLDGTGERLRPLPVIERTLSVIDQVADHGQTP